MVMATVEPLRHEQGWDSCRRSRERRGRHRAVLSGTLSRAVLGQLAEFVSAVEEEVKQHFAPEEIKGLRNPGRIAPARMRRIGPHADSIPDARGSPGDDGQAPLDAGLAPAAGHAPQPAAVSRGARPQGGRRIVDRPGSGIAHAGGGAQSVALGAGWLKQLALAGAAPTSPALAPAPPAPPFPNR